MTQQQSQIITKETQKTILKAICDNPTLPVEDLSVSLKSKLTNISEEDIFQVIYTISPNKNWNRATQEELQKEILNYTWTLETQILLLLPVKQKETTIAEFNQIRLEHKQSRVTKDIIRHLQAALMVDGKNLAKFRKFYKDLAMQLDLDPDIQASWLVRLILVTMKNYNLNNLQELSSFLINELKDKHQLLNQKVSKNLQRICERFVEKYFPKNLTEPKLKELISSYQSIFSKYETQAESDSLHGPTLKDQNKLIFNAIEQLKQLQEIVLESHEKGFFGRLFSGSIKNKGGIIGKIDEVISLVNEINELNDKTNKTINDKSLLVQKLQSDYENMLLIKNQLEHDLYNINEKFKTFEEKSSRNEKEFQDKVSSLDQAHERINNLQQKVDEIPQLESKINLLREELSLAKSIAISLYSRITRLKDDLLKQNPDTQKTAKVNGNQNISNHVIHKVLKDETTGERILTTEVNT